MNEYTTYDSEQPVHFTGELLASITTDDGLKDRWTEIEIYRTRAGSYIIHKNGNSRLPDDRVLHSSQVSETPEGCIESLRSYDDDGVMYMRATDKCVLLDAMDVDPDLAAAWKSGINVA